MTTPIAIAPLPVETRWLTAADGVRLWVRCYQPTNHGTGRTIFWSHGVGEHGGRYDHVVAEYLARGWQVILPDLRGHGQSEGIRADVSSFEIYLRDFDQIIQEFSLEPQQTVLFGHSLGGLVMTRFAQTRQSGWAALAMSAPLLGIAIPIPLWKWWLGKFLAVTVPKMHLRTGIRAANLTHDPEFLARRRADPQIQRSVTVRWFFAMLAALDQAHQDAKTLTLPILVLQGTSDETTDPRAAATWLRSTGSPDSRMIEYPNGLHELLNDTGWQTVCGDLLNWLEQRVPIIS